LENTQTIWYPRRNYYSTKKTAEDVIPVGGEEVEIEGSVGVKQGDNLGPILFMYLIKAVSSTTMAKKWTL